MQVVKASLCQCFNWSIQNFNSMTKTMMNQFICSCAKIMEKLKLSMTFKRNIHETKLHEGQGIDKILATKI